MFLECFDFLFVPIFANYAARSAFRACNQYNLVLQLAELMNCHSVVTQFATTQRLAATLTTFNLN